MAQLARPRWLTIGRPLTRLRADSYERLTSGVSAGIPSEGVVVYEIDEAAWPVQLRTQIALIAGKKYSNPAEQIEIEVTAAVPGGFTVTIRATEHPDCPGIRTAIVEAEGAIRAFQGALQTAPRGAKAALVAQITQWQAKLRAAQQRRTQRGCIP